MSEIPRSPCVNRGKESMAGITVVLQEIAKEELSVRVPHHLS
jgi:hypothetical protein